MSEYTKEELKRIVLGFADDYSNEELGISDDEWHWAKENVRLVQEGEDVVEHNSVYNHNIYAVNGFFFDVTFTRDNSGYWGDGERHPPKICEVVPVQVVRTEYKVVS